MNYTQLEEEIGTKKILVFGGFSGLGYSDIDRLKNEIKNRIEKEIEFYGKDNLVVLSGATSDGIGVCYEIAKKLDVPTYGIVSDAAKEYGSDKFCDKTFYVPDPKGSWQVLSENGSSYMVDIAKNNGTLVYYGGGDVAVSEIREALERKIDTEVFTDFEPNPTQVAKKKAKNPNLDPTPLKTYMDAEWTKQYESNLIAEQGIPKGFKFEDGKLIKQESLPNKIKNVLSSFRELNSHKNDKSNTFKS